MNLIDLIHRPAIPQPWSEGEKIPWNDPAFSQRMLQEHLSQEHDAASRRIEIIDKQVAWIHHSILSNRPTRILDLGCGPGLYTSRLAKLGHECTGIDFSPASLAYAVDLARAESLRCSYLQQDIRTADFGQGFGLVMLIFGEFNTFRPNDARSILAKAYAALGEGGILLLEPHPYSTVRRIGEKPASWYSSKGGLFSERPHIGFIENFWDSQLNAATKRYFIIDGLTGEVTQHTEHLQAYTDDQYQILLEECGFDKVAFYPSLTGEIHPPKSDLMAVVAQKR